MSSSDRMRIAEIPYYACFLMLFGFRAIGGHEGWEIYKYTLLIGVAFFCIKILMTGHTVYEYLWILILLSTAGLTYQYTGEKGLLLNYLMMLGIKGVPEKRLFRIAAIFLGASMVTVVFLAVIGVIPDIQFGPTGRRFWGTMLRHSMGYPHTNTLLTTYIILMMLCLYLVGRDSKKKVIQYSLVLYGFAIYLYIYCDSTTGLVISTGYIILNYLFQFCLRFRKWEVVLIGALYPLINLFAIGGVLLYREEWMSVPGLTSFFDRFRLANKYWNTYPFSPFGIRLETGIRYGIDISQIHLFLNLGIVAFGVVSALYLLALREMIREKNRGALAIILTLMIMGITDPLLYNLSCKNLTFLFMGIAFYRVTGRSKTVTLSVLKKEIRILRCGEQTIPQRWVERIYVAREKSRRYAAIMARDKHGFELPLIAAAIAASGYAIYGYSRIEPIQDSYRAGFYEYIRLTVSIGVWIFLFGMMIRWVYAFRHYRDHAEKKQ